MTTSNTPRTLTLLAALAMATPAAADRVDLADGRSWLTGTVLAIHDMKLIELQSPLSPDPIPIQGERLAKLAFTRDTRQTGPAPVRIRLFNGDMIPATGIRGIEDGHLLVQSSLTGPVRIPTGSLVSAQFGVHPNRPVYSGFGSLEEWVDDMEERENWKFRNRSLLATGDASASKTFALPEDFILSLKLEWDEKSPPVFSLDLASSRPAGRSQPDDFYRFTFSNAGMHLIRQESGRDGGRHILTQLRRLPAHYTKHRIDVELRVKRSARRLELFINGEPEGLFADPIGNQPPGGNVITLSCNGRKGSTQKISEIRIEEFNDTHSRHLTEKRGDPAKDVLITRDDDRLTGRLTGIRNEPSGNILLFQSDFRDSPLQIPQSEASTLHFARDPGADEAAAGSAPWLIEMADGGILRADDCRMDDTGFSVMHRLLGRLDLQPDGVLTLTKTQHGSD